MPTIYSTAASLDGFVADDAHGLGWLLRLPHPNVQDFDRFVATVGAIAMGASTYEWLLRHEVFADPDAPQPWPYVQPTWVFTHRTLPTVPGADVRLVQGDVRPVHAAMAEAARGQNVWVVGGGDLAGQFYDAGLLDEIVVTIASVTLGSGKPVLPRRIEHPALRLTDVERFGETFVALTYTLSGSGP